MHSILTGKALLGVTSEFLLILLSAAFVYATYEPQKEACTG